MFGSLFKRKGQSKPSSMQVMTVEEHKRLHNEKCKSCSCYGCSRNNSCRCLLCDDTVDAKVSCSEKVD